MKKTEVLLLNICVCITEAYIISQEVQFLFYQGLSVTNNLKCFAGYIVF